MLERFVQLTVQYIVLDGPSSFQCGPFSKLVDPNSGS